jgi:replicative superfamily II helicase
LIDAVAFFALSIIVYIAFLTASTMSDEDALKLPKSRGYQLEMLEESLQRNIIIALDTGAGKTHIAVLRMKQDLERESSKVSLFHRSIKYYY